MSHKILLFTYKALNDQAPSYLKDLMMQYFPNRELCSKITCLLVVPRVSKSIVRRGASWEVPQQCRPISA